ncbi:MAG: hypothetical protein ACUZ8E_15850 [Candidatus Anammoxibacter sp.]
MAESEKKLTNEQIANLTKLINELPAGVSLNDIAEVPQTVWDILDAYGKVLVETEEEYPLLKPMSKLPYSKEVINESLNLVMQNTNNEDMKNNIKNVLPLLESFVPDDKIPNDKKQQQKILDDILNTN